MKPNKYKITFWNNKEAKEVIKTISAWDAKDAWFQAEQQAPSIGGVDFWENPILSVKSVAPLEPEPAKEEPLK